MDRKAVNKNSAYVCTAAQMRLVDAACTESAKIPGIVLMENAALGCVREIEKRFNVPASGFAIFCGGGNNGGDGLAIARQLASRGGEVFVYLVGGRDYSGDARINYEIVSEMGIAMMEIDNAQLLPGLIKDADCVVDAMLGTGISGAPRANVAAVIRAINENARFVLAVDMPSGANSDGGAVAGECVRADVTVTFAAYKRGMFLYPAADFCGELVLCNITTPDYISEVKAGRCFAVKKEDALAVFPRRRNNSHKGDYGKVMIIGGSVGMAGAPAMAARAALRCGAGLVTAAVPASVNNIIQTKIDEVMTIPLPEERGRISRTAAERLARRANTCDAVLLGVGLGRGEPVTAFVAEILPLLTVPTVLDADGIYAAAQSPGLLEKTNCELVLTPHSQELGYLTGKSAAEIEKSRFFECSDFAAKNGVTLILKGHHTIITAPDGDTSVNMTGNPGMATGGSGDVLAGMTAALLGRGLGAYDAAVCAVCLHGAAGDDAAARLGRDAMCAGDISESISHRLPVEF